MQLIRIANNVGVCSGGSRISQRGVRQPQKGGGANLLFDQFSLKTAWKWRNFGPEVGARVPCAPLDPPLVWKIHLRNIILAQSPEFYMRSTEQVTTPALLKDRVFTVQSIERAFSYMFKTLWCKFLFIGESSYMLIISLPFCSLLVLFSSAINETKGSEIIK